VLLGALLYNPRPVSAIGDASVGDAPLPADCFAIGRRCPAALATLRLPADALQALASPVGAFRKNSSKA